MGASEGGSGHLTLHGTKGDLLVIAGEDQNSGLLMVNNDLGTNIFLAGADSAQGVGLIRGESAGAGAGGNGGVHVNAVNGANLIFIGADEQTNGTVGIWDRNGQGSIIRK